MGSVSVELVHETEAGERELYRAAAGSACELPAFATGPNGKRVDLHRDSVTPDGGLVACVACGHPELYTQKDFPRLLGFAIVVVAAVLAPRTRYLSLVIAAALDFALYRLAPDVVVCYVCGARHRGFRKPPKHPHFDREIEERLRYGDRAVMGKPMRPGGTADAPEPEH